MRYTGLVRLRDTHVLKIGAIDDQDNMEGYQGEGRRFHRCLRS